MAIEHAPLPASEDALVNRALADAPRDVGSDSVALRAVYDMATGSHPAQVLPTPKQGLFNAAQKAPAAARRVRPQTLGIVVHRAETYDASEYHLCVREDGSVESLTPLADKANHACSWNDRTLGVVVFGCFARGYRAVRAHPTQAQLDSLDVLVRGLNWWFCAGTAERLWVSGHSELGPTGTRVPAKLSLDPDYSCPGLNLDMDALRVRVGAGPCPESHGRLLPLAQFQPEQEAAREHLASVTS